MNSPSARLPQGSLFTKYGGISALRSVIMMFYDAVLDSDVIGHFFDDVDMARLVDHQTRFFAMLLGGPAEFSDDRLARAHAHLGLTHDHFDEVGRILAETLDTAGFAPEDRNIVMAEIEARRSIIVS